MATRSALAFTDDARRTPARAPRPPRGREPRGAPGSALAFPDGARRNLGAERYQHPDPRVQRRMEVLWLLSQGETQTRAGQLAGVSTAPAARHRALLRPP